MTENEILESLISGGSQIDVERRLALTYVQPRQRSSLAALWALDARLGAVIAAGGQPMVRQLKLAWWREAIEALDGGSVPTEPVLIAVAANLPARGISGVDLGRMVTGWEYLTDPEPLSAESLAHYARLRGGLLFGFSARLLGCSEREEVQRAGEAWALVDLARRASRAEEARSALEAADARCRFDRSWPRALRSLGMLAALALRDAKRGADRIEPQGSPRRMLRMAGHRLTGR